MLGLEPNSNIYKHTLMFPLEIEALPKVVMDKYQNRWTEIRLLFIFYQKDNNNNNNLCNARRAEGGRMMILGGRD